MSALILAWVLFAAPVRAGTVAAVEAGAVPSSPVGTITPVAAPVGGGLSAPTLGGATLIGGVPVLPSPVPGLAGALNFVGGRHEAAVRPSGGEAAAVAVETPATAAPGKKAAPTIPGKPATGAGFVPVGHDRSRKTGAVALDAAANLASGAESGAEAGEGSASNAAFGGGGEKAAGMGRKFFDQSRDESRGLLDGSYAVLNDAGPGFAGGGAVALKAAWKPAAASSPAADEALGLGHGGGDGFGPGGEQLRDAVAGVPSAAGAGAAAGAFGSAANSAALSGRLSAPSTPEPVAGFGTGAFGAAHAAPSPLSLDLSGAGLIVRVRSALGAALAPAPAAPAPAKALAPVPSAASTAWLERGGLLEAMSAVEAYSGTGLASSAVPAKAAAFAATAPARPAPSPLLPSWWWAWAFLPLAGYLLRSFL